MAKTRSLTFIAILGALSFVLMFFSFPIIPGADFLKIELSILPILLGLVLLDLRSAYAILILRSVLKLLLNNKGVNDYIGLPMNMAALGIFVLVFALLWKGRESRKTFILTSLVATVSLTAVMLLLNYVYAIPLYATFANFDIAAFIGVRTYLTAMVLPFNLIQGLIFSLVFGVTYPALKSLLERFS